MSKLKYIFPLLLWSALLHAQPNLKVVWPLFGANNYMNLQWDPVPMAAEYEVRYKVNAGAYGAWVSAGTAINWAHPDVMNMTDTYTFQVRSRVGAAWSAPSNERANKFTKEWPVSSDGMCTSEGLDVLNGFNQPIFVGTHYLHEGIDIHGTETIASECVRAPMGGVIRHAGGAAQDVYVAMDVYMNGHVEKILFNHLDDVLDPALMVGESVMPGQRLGTIKGGIWNTLSSHTHFQYYLGPGFLDGAMDPHKFFDSNSHRDPRNRNPRVGNSNADADSLRFRHGPDLDTYFMKDTVCRETDIVAEAFDPQSTDAPWAAPKSIGYFIQRHDGTNWVGAVKSSASPYLLTDNANGFYGVGAGSSNADITHAISDRNLQSTSPTTPTPQATGYAWTQYWGYQVTNTNGTNGMVGNLSRDECWATDARSSVASDNGYAMNYDRARVIDEAKFKDGRYRVNIRLRDWVNSPPDFQREVFVDNFRPYVKECRIESGELHYAAIWNWNAGSGQLTLNSNMDADSVCGDVDVFLTFSEPMKEISLSVSSLSYIKNTNMAEANSNNEKWKFTIPSSTIAAHPQSGPHVLSINGVDKNGNFVQGFPGSAAMPGANIPKRQHNNAWSPNTAPFPDTIHKFRIKTVPVKIAFEVDSLKCADGMDGKITVNATEGKAPYKYSKDNGSTWQNSNVFDGLRVGSYSIRVMDADSCSASKDTIVPSPPLLYLSVSGGGLVTFCLQDGPPTVTLSASASGGVPDYTYAPSQTLTVSSTSFHTFTVTDKKDCTESKSTLVVVIPILCSRDPNDIIGPEGYGDARWVAKKDVLPYTIRFENDPDFASAPAQRVAVEHFPDEDLNLFSFKLGDFGFANMIFTVPENATFYSKRLDLVDSLGVLVDVTAGIDVTQNKVFWIFESIDPATGLAPIDPLVGLLPVNDTLVHDGEGFVNFTIKPKNSAVTGDSILAEAAIVFDVNDTIQTPQIFNVVDALPPSSMVTGALPASVDTTSFTISWSAEDDPGGSGLREYELYYSVNGGAFLLYQSGILDTFTTFTGTAGNAYAFFTLATDNVGNTEAIKSSGDVSTTIAEGKSLAIFSQSDADLCAGDSLSVQWSASGIQRVDVLLSSNGGTTFSTLQANLPAAQSLYTWHIPAAFPGCADCKIMVADTALLSPARDTATAVVHALPNVEAGSDQATCQGSPAQLLATGGLSYIWTPSIGLSNSLIANPLALPASATEYAVLATDAFGCRNTDTVLVSLLPKDTTYLVNMDCDEDLVGLDVDTLTNQHGCDSLLFIDVQMQVNNLLITNNNLLGGTYRSAGQLTSHSTTVGTGLDVRFLSDEGVLLQGVFTVELGAEFEANIEVCSSTGANAGGLSGLLKKIFKKKKK